MIKLKTLIIEASTKRDAFSWLSPEGKFFPVSITHQDIADKLSKAEDPLDDLFSKGWQRVRNSDIATDYPSSSVNDLYTFNPDKMPNRIQLAKLIDLAIEYGYDNLYYDKGYDYDGIPLKTLWSSKNTLE
jgi:hypothetical protein